MSLTTLENTRWAFPAKKDGFDLSMFTTAQDYTLHFNYTYQGALKSGTVVINPANWTSANSDNTVSNSIEFSYSNTLRDPFLEWNNGRDQRTSSKYVMLWHISSSTLTPVNTGVAAIIPGNACKFDDENLAILRTGYITDTTVDAELLRFFEVNGIQLNDSSACLEGHTIYLAEHVDTSSFPKDFHCDLDGVCPYVIPSSGTPSSNLLHSHTSIIFNGGGMTAYSEEEHRYVSYGYSYHIKVVSRPLDNSDPTDELYYLGVHDILYTNYDLEDGEGWYNHNIATDTMTKITADRVRIPYGTDYTALTGINGTSYSLELINWFNDNAVIDPRPEPVPLTGSTDYNFKDVLALPNVDIEVSAEEEPIGKFTFSVDGSTTSSEDLYNISVSSNLLVLANEDYSEETIYTPTNGWFCYNGEDPVQLTSADVKPVTINTAAARPVSFDNFMAANAVISGGATKFLMAGNKVLKFGTKILISSGEVGPTVPQYNVTTTFNGLDVVTPVANDPVRVKANNIIETSFKPAEGNSYNPTIAYVKGANKAVITEDDDGIGVAKLEVSELTGNVEISLAAVEEPVIPVITSYELTHVTADPTNKTKFVAGREADLKFIPETGYIIEKSDTTVTLQSGSSSKTISDTTYNTQTNTLSFTLPDDTYNYRTLKVQVNGAAGYPITTNIIGGTLSPDSSGGMKPGAEAYVVIIPDNTHIAKFDSWEVINADGEPFENNPQMAVIRLTNPTGPITVNVTLKLSSFAYYRFNEVCDFSSYTSAQEETISGTPAFLMTYEGQTDIFDVGTSELVGAQYQMCICENDGEMYAFILSFTQEDIGTVWNIYASQDIPDMGLKTGWNTWFANEEFAECTTALSDCTAEQKATFLVQKLDLSNVSAECKAIIEANATKL